MDKTTPAFPIYDTNEFNGQRFISEIGLTKREYFAAMAMQGMTSNNSITVETVAAWAVQYADALLAELGKEGK